MEEILDFKISKDRNNWKVVEYKGKTYFLRDFASMIGVSPSLLHLNHKQYPETYHIEVSKSVWKKANKICSSKKVFLNDDGHFEVEKPTRACALEDGDLAKLSNKSRSYKLANIPNPSKFELNEIEVLEGT